MQDSRFWGAHARRVLFPAPSPGNLTRWRISPAFVVHSARRRMLHARARALPRMQHAARRFGRRDGACPSKLCFLYVIIAALAMVDLTGCATTSSHQFTEPAGDWQMRNGQLLYRNAKTTLIGEVLVRYSKNGDFDLTFSKGAGVILLALRQDNSFAEIKGPLVRGGWSGQVEQAPQRLRSWLDLREKLIHALATASPSGGGQNRRVVHYAARTETFLFRF